MATTLQTLIDTYGYLAILIGTLLEGETILAMGGFAAQRGYLDLPVVITVGLSGGFLGDQILFFLGRLHGPKILARFPTMARRAAKVDKWLYRYHAPLIVAIRFAYGFRIVGPIVFGMGRVPAGKFILYNLIGACLWAFLVAGIGFLFGQGLELLLADAKRYEWVGLGVLAGVSLVLWAVYRNRIG